MLLSLSIGLLWFHLEQVCNVLHSYSYTGTTGTVLPANPIQSALSRFPIDPFLISSVLSVASWSTFSLTTIRPIRDLRLADVRSSGAGAGTGTGREGDEREWKGTRYNSLSRVPSPIE